MPTPLNLGEAAPWFTAPTPSNPQFVFDTAAGRYVLMVLLPKGDAPAAAEALQRLAMHRARFDDQTLSAFIVTRVPETAATAQDMQGLHWVLDVEGDVSRLYGAVQADGTEAPMWLLLDPTLPAIERVFQFQATRLERYLVACYDAGDGGYFRPHRDNETLGTAHRRFAVSINLNAEEFEGGDLRFPEFGQRTYRPPTGGAVVFCCSLQHEAGHAIRERNLAFLQATP